MEIQEIQCGKRDPSVFKETIFVHPEKSGVKLHQTREGRDFWFDVGVGNFDLFYSKYPKPHHIKAPGGFSLRDYFAAKAMQSILLEKHSSKTKGIDIAYWSYNVADAMIKQRNKK